MHCIRQIQFIILNYHHVANNNITVNELNICLMYLYINTLFTKKLDT